MNPLAKRLSGSPVAARVVPFVLFCAITWFQGKLGRDSQYWVYLAKTILGAWMVWAVRPLWSEMEWRCSWEGVAAGILVFGLWVGLDGLYPGLDQLLGGKHGRGGPAGDPTSWNLARDFVAGSGAFCFFGGLRVIGSALVVPPLEEIFFRSFFYRYLIASDFMEVPLSRFNWRAFVLAALFFGAEHNEWLAGILCACVYQGLVCWKGRLGDAVTAHAVTNFLLGCWVIWRGAWAFW
jgi:hypothetical protein